GVVRDRLDKGSGGPDEGAGPQPPKGRPTLGCPSWDVSSAARSVVQDRRSWTTPVLLAADEAAHADPGGVVDLCCRSTPRRGTDESDAQGKREVARTISRGVRHRLSGPDADPGWNHPVRDSHTEHRH